MTTTLDDYIDLVEGARLRRLVYRGRVPYTRGPFGVYLFNRLDFLQFRAGYLNRPGRKPSGRLL